MAMRSKEFRNPGRDARKVLIIKLSALGDVIMALGAMRAIREAHPAASITWLTTPAFEELAQKCPYVDRVETDGRPDKVAESNELVNRIREEKYDIVYDLHCSDRTANYFRAMNAFGRRPPLWCGHAPKCAFPFTDPDRKKIPAIERHARQLELAGLGPFESLPRPDMSWAFRDVETNPRLKPDYFNLSNNYALIMAGSSEGHPAKRWPAEAFGDLARRLDAVGIEAVLIGTTADGHINSEIGHFAPKARNLTTRTDLFQLGALASGAQIVIGNDTGPTHLAAASGARTIALFGTNHSHQDTVIAKGDPTIVVFGETVADIPVDTVWQLLPAMGVISR